MVNLQTPLEKYQFGLAVLRFKALQHTTTQEKFEDKYR